jgi:hypothetical protein
VILEFGFFLRLRIKRALALVNLGQHLHHKMKSKNVVLFGIELVIFLSFISCASAQHLTFTATSYARGNNGTHIIAMADVNFDGKIDLICANYGIKTDPSSGDSVTVLTNNGSGVFGLNATLVVTNGAEFVLATDINGDGKVDLIISTQNSSMLSVFTNNGSGIFSLNSILQASADPVWVSTADVNGDGFPDLITANVPGNTLTILTNNGTGVFGLSTNLPTGNFPDPVLAGDLNGDGKPDLICVNSNDGTITIFTNNGSGFFRTETNFTPGNVQFSIATSDLNGDGKPDLILPNWNVNTLSVWTNNGLGIFSSNATYNVGVGPESVTVADVNGDGYPDLITANDNGCPGSSSCAVGSLTILTNNGSGRFNLSSAINIGYWPDSAVAADVNGDGKQDLIGVNNGGGPGQPNTLTELINTSVFPRPTLKLAKTGKNLTVLWPASAVSFALQTNSVLGSTNWGNYPATVSSDGFINKITNSTTTGTLLFRLKQ